MGLDHADVEQGAIKIQSTFRGRKSRQQVLDKKKEMGVLREEDKPTPAFSSTYFSDRSFQTRPPPHDFVLPPPGLDLPLQVCLNPLSSPATARNEKNVQFTFLLVVSQRVDTTPRLFPFSFLPMIDSATDTPSRWTSPSISA